MPVASFFTGLDVWLAAAFFAAATAVVVVAAPRLTSVVDALSTRTKFGQSLAGTVLLGASTSLPGIMVTVVATLRGDIALAVANAVGGVVAQTSFLAVADVAHRRGDLFRAAVSPKALTQVGTLLILLAVPLFALSGWPNAAVWSVHPASAALVVVYGAGLWAARREPKKNGGQQTPAHDGQQTSAHRGQSTSPQRQEAPLSTLWRKYALFVLLIGVAGFIIGTTISPISQSLGLSSIAAGALVTAGATSSPELITAITAARRGKLTLAVGDIVGGNMFDILFLVVADLVFAGAMYSQLGGSIALLLAIAILLNAVLLLGFVRARSSGSASPESLIILGLYLVLAVLLLVVPPEGGGGG